MPRFLLALVLLAAAESAAIACSCIMPPKDSAARRALAKDVAIDALALVEVELVAPYDGRRARGERLRVLRTLAGQAGAGFEVERSARPSSAACDLTFRRGGRTLVILYPSGPRKGAPVAGRYRVSDSCTSNFLADADFRATLAAEIGRRR